MGKWFFTLLMQVLGAMTPQLRKTLEAFAKDFREQARKTPNPWDDLLADVICSLLGVK